MFPSGLVSFSSLTHPPTHPPHTLSHPSSGSSQQPAQTQAVMEERERENLSRKSLKSEPQESGVFVINDTPSLILSFSPSPWLSFSLSHALSHSPFRFHSHSEQHTISPSLSQSHSFLSQSNFDIPVTLFFLVSSFQSHSLRLSVILSYYLYFLFIYTLYVLKGKTTGVEAQLYVDHNDCWRFCRSCCSKHVCLFYTSPLTLWSTMIMMIMMARGSFTASVVIHAIFVLKTLSVIFLETRCWREHPYSSSHVLPPAGWRAQPHPAPELAPKKLYSFHDWRLYQVTNCGIKCWTYSVYTHKINSPEIDQRFKIYSLTSMSCTSQEIIEITIKEDKLQQELLLLG